jgi:hypothetical protein
LAEGQGDLARGLYYSILFMLSMPFAIAGTFATVCYRAVQREKRRQASVGRASLGRASLGRAAGREASGPGEASEPRDRA